MFKPMLVTCVLFTLGACSQPFNEYLPHPADEVPPPAPASTANPGPQVARGQYLVGLLGCGSCHSNGALTGKPNLRQLLAGSDTGIAWSNPLYDRNPAIVFPSNLTPDMETGLGRWSVQEIVKMLETGAGRHGQNIWVMPWPSYQYIAPEDATAIAVYLKSLPALQHKVPADVPRGQPASAPFIHVGIYHSK